MAPGQRELPASLILAQALREACEVARRPACRLKHHGRKGVQQRGALLGNLRQSGRSRSQPGRRKSASLAPTLAFKVTDLSYSYSCHRVGLQGC